MNKSLEKLIAWFRTNIVEYGIDNYSEAEIEQCEHILQDYCDKLQSITAPDDKGIMECVETVVLALNELNESCDYSFIETEEREMLWEFIQTTAIQTGLVDYSEDITEKFREW